MKRFKLRRLVFYTLLLCAGLEACNDKGSNKAYQPTFTADTSKNKTLIWGFPSFSYCENAEPIVKYLNKRLLGVHIVVKACVSWNEYTDYLNQNKFNITLVNGLEALDATNHGYVIFGKIMEDGQHAGVIFVRTDAGIKQWGDLKGKAVAMAPSHMIPSVMISLYYLHEHGLNINNDIQKVNVSSFESAIIATYLGKSEAGLSNKRNWNIYIRDHPEVLSKVELKWETSPLINNALLVKNTTDEDTRSQLITLFFHMHTTPEGKNALKRLGITGFEKANSSTYKSMQDFKRKYDAITN